MARPTKCRKVCHYPQTQEFLPVKGGAEKAPVILTVDEYEAIRLMDGEGLSQAECSAFMQIARTTVQRIYESARKKLAAVLVEGRPLRIEGGDFRLCDGGGSRCGNDRCFKKLYRQQHETVVSNSGDGALTGVLETMPAATTAAVESIIVEKIMDFGEL